MKNRPAGKKIGLVIGQLSPGGAERQVTRLAIELSQRSDYIPIVYCLSAFTDPFGPELTSAGIQWSAPPRQTGFRIFKLLWLIWQIRSSGCILLYGFLQVGNAYAGLASLCLGLPYIASMRSANSTFSIPFQVLSRIFFDRADMIVSNSESGLKILFEEFHIHHKRVTLIPNIIVPLLFSPEVRQRIRKEWGVADDELVVGTVAQVKEEKRTWLFVDTFAALNLRMPAHFVWVGGGQKQATLEAQTAALDPQIRMRMHLEGYQADIAGYLSAFDIFILTSAYEGSPNALLEAMSAQKVCIATAVPGITDVFAAQEPGRVTGVLCDREDPEKIAASIAEVWQDREQMKCIAQNAREWIDEQFSPESVVAIYVQLFSRILASS